MDGFGNPVPPAIIMRRPAAPQPTYAQHGAVVLPATKPVRERPLGIAILAILNIVTGGAIAAVGLFGGAFLANLAGDMPVVGEVFAALGLVIGLFGLVFLAVGFGMWNGSGWAWSLNVVLLWINVIFSIFLILAVVGILTLLIYLVMLWYFYRPKVKYFFGKGPPPGPVVHVQVV